jgi:predicted nucleic acid-binding protein
MTVLFDTSVLILALQPNAKPPLDPSTDKPVEHAKQRVEYLVKMLSKAKTKVIIPSPVLSELLVGAGSAGPQYIQELQKTPFRVSPFDTRAAIECADAIANHGVKGKSTETRAKVKFDRQIVAIARVERVDAIYSDDDHIHKLGAQAGLRVIRTFELELDPDEAQHKLPLVPRVEPDEEEMPSPIEIVAAEQRIVE